MTQLTGRAEEEQGTGAGPEGGEAGRSGPRHLAARGRGGARLGRPDWARLGAGLLPLWRPLAVLLSARLAMWAAVFVYSHVFHRYAFNLWDGGWYVQAAQKGWPHHVLPGFGGPAQDTLAFFPGFPTVIRVVHFLVPVSWTTAGRVAAFLSEVAMVTGVWMLARDVWGRQVADRGIVAVCFFPGAFILDMMYSEPLTIAAAAFCLLALRRRQWLLAGVMGAVGTATRVVALALVVACAWEAFRAIRDDRDWMSLSSVVISPAGIVGWFLYLWASTGDAMAWLHTERNGWAQHSTLTAIPDLIRSVLHTHPAQMDEVLALASTVLGVVLLVVLIASRAPSVLTVYSVVILALGAASVNPSGIRFRFVLTAFPLVLVAARYLKDAAFAVVVSFSSLLMGVILVITLMGPPVVIP